MTKATTDLEWPEQTWLEGWDMDRQAELIRRLREVGESEAVAFGIAGWLTSIAHDLPRDAGGSERKKRWRYRQVLADLGPPERTRPRKRRRQTGAVDVRLLSTVLAVVGVVAAATGLPHVLALTPIIFDDVNEVGAEVIAFPQRQVQKRAA